MKILVAYDSSWHTLGYYHDRYFHNKSHEVFGYPLDQSPALSDLRGCLPFYVTRGLPVTLQSLENKYKTPFDFVLEVDGPGQHHIFKKRSSRLHFLWSHDIQREDKQKLHRWIEKDSDFIFCALKSYLPFFKHRPAVWLPFACDPETHSKLDLPKVHDVVFVGNTDPRIYADRVKMLEALSRKFKISVFNGIYGKETSKIYSQAKMILNICSFGEINSRIFEALSCGSLLLTNRLGAETGLNELFQDRRHLVLYDRVEDLSGKIEYYLSHADERERIALEGHKEALSKHTYSHRADVILKTAQDFLKR